MMHAEVAETALASLSEMLEQEAAALRAGDFAALEGLAGRKAGLLEDLATSPLSAGAAAALRSRAERNARLLEAARAGLENGMRRLRTLAAPAAPLQTYDGTGQRNVLAAPPAGARRRA